MGVSRNLKSKFLNNDAAKKFKYHWRSHRKY
jgi:hypothetical protein